MIVTGGERIMKAEGKEFEMKEGYVFFIEYNTNLSLQLSLDLKHISHSQKHKYDDRYDYKIAIFQEVMYQLIRLWLLV